MTTNSAADPVQKILAAALIIFPCVFMLVFLMHFRRASDFYNFKLHYVPRSPDRVVAGLINGHNRGPLIHDPHMIAYLTLPILVLCALALYVLGREKRPVASAITLMITIAGTIYTGGLFGMWTAFYHGIALVDPANAAGATATFAAMTSPQGAFLVTTSLAKLLMIGFAAQAIVLLGTRAAPLWAILCIVLGAVAFLAFWDLDNWMLIGTALILAGFVPLRKALLSNNQL